MVQENSLDNKILIICGPTASGKTALAVECAKLLDSEIISADSMYIYKGLDIGTAKPTEIEKQGVKHHLIDVAGPSDTFSVGDYRELAIPIIDDLISKGKIPVICGGTGFYINSILYDFSYGNAGSNLIAREKYFNLASEHGNQYVFDILCDVDPESAKKLHPNDLKRVVRALEIYESGQKKSEIIDDLTPRYNYKAVTIDFSREELYDRINNRVDIMVKDGLIDEVKRLLAQNITLENQCMQGIGYKEIVSYLQGDCSIEEAVETLKLNTRHYAKRQITFFKKLNGLEYLKPDAVDKLARRIIEELW